MDSAVRPPNQSDTLLNPRLIASMTSNWTSKHALDRPATEH